MPQIVVTKGGVTTTTTTTTTYKYNDDGNCILQTEQVDGGVITTTLFHVDPHNHTGYAQVLEEGIDDNANGNLASAEVDKSYALGHDILSQATTTTHPTVTVQFLLYDGHGSTRTLANATGGVLQRYAYDAYGNQLTGTGLTSADLATTRFLYSGERTDKTGLQYLRARYYDPRSGRFTQLDPFAGNVQDPLSLHKYLYVHGDPIQGSDPSGMMTLSSSLAGLSVGSILMAGASGWALSAVFVANQFGYIDTPTSESGIAEGFVPFWGSGKNFLYHINNGQPLSATADAAFFVTDFSAVKGIAKLGYRAFLNDWKQAAKPGVFWAVWGFPQKTWGTPLSNHFMWQDGDFVYDATLVGKKMIVERELASQSVVSGSYAAWKLRLSIPLPALFKDAANTCGATGGNCLTHLVSAMEAAGVPEAVQTVIKGVYVYDINNP